MKFFGKKIFVVAMLIMTLLFGTTEIYATESGIGKPSDHPGGNMEGNIKVEAYSVDTGLYLSWEEVEDNAGYTLCRFENGEFVVIAELDSDATHYNDVNVEDGKEYIYGLIAKKNDDMQGAGLDRYRIVTVTYNEKEADEINLDTENETATVELEKKPEPQTFDDTHGMSREEILNKTADILSGITGQDAAQESSQGTDQTASQSAASGAASMVSTYDTFNTIIDKRLENTTADYCIEADVKLSGTGSGYHAKIVMGTSQSAVSFGIQYDVGASAPYAGKTMAILENIQSNYNGLQQYPRFAELERSRTYRLMLTLNKDGYGEAYVNGHLVGTYQNPYVLNSGNIDMWVEGAARLTGDSVNATFSNVRARKNGVVVYGANGEIVDDAIRANGIKCYSTMGIDQLTNETTTMNVISGTVHGIGDWDSSFNNASSLVHVKI